jgi:predicted RNase H-like HicB family nuclease
MRSYVALIHKDRGSDYGVSFPDFPGCVTAGSDLDEARGMAEEALAFHVDGMIEDGATVPEPTPLENVMSVPENRDGVAVIVDLAPQPEQPVRLNITLPGEALREIDAFVEARGVTRSSFIAAAARKAIQDEAA